MLRGAGGELAVKQALKPARRKPGPAASAASESGSSMLPSMSASARCSAGSARRLGGVAARLQIARPADAIQHQMLGDFAGQRLAVMTADPMKHHVENGAGAGAS